MRMCVGASLSPHAIPERPLARNLGAPYGSSMPQTPNIVSDRPRTPDEQADVVSEVLRAVRLGAEVFGRFELGAPWAMRVPRVEELLSFYVVARGGAWLDVEFEGRSASARRLALSAGDVVLLPHGESHVL